MSEPDNDPQMMSLGSVWQRFGDQLRRRARTRLRQYGLTGQAESMDICNDVMTDLVRRQEHSAGDQQVRSPDEILSYIMRAIDNQVIDTFRTLARQCRDFRRNEPSSPEVLQMAGGVTTPSQIALRREVIDRIRSLLNPDDVVAIDMMLENRDWNEIGQAMGLPPDTIRIRIRRALKNASREMGLDDEDPT